MILDWLSRKAPLRYPVPPAPATAVLVPSVRPTGRVRVFAEGWGPEAEAFQPAAIAGDWKRLRALIGETIPSLTHALIVLARSPEELLSEGRRKELWRAFRVPVFEQILGENGMLLAAECEAHDGLHVESPELASELERNSSLSEEPCGCGRTSPRLKAVGHRDRLVAAL